jgi:hypothetical protein
MRLKDREIRRNVVKNTKARQRSAPVRLKYEGPATLGPGPVKIRRPGNAGPSLVWDYK